MADLMELNIVANVSSVKQAVSTVSRLEKQLFAAVKAIDKGIISQQRFNRVLESAKSQYKDYAGNAGLAAINVNKLVKEQKASIATANAAKAATEAANQAEKKRLAGIKAMQTALLAQKTAEEANTAALKSMKLGYDKLYSTEQKALRLKKLLRTEIANGTMTVRQAGKELLNYRNAQMAASKATQASKRMMNSGNMAVQQLGYQFGDFAVQVQGGTSAFVAFSQQGAQLAGILPMIAGPLGLSMGAAVGLSAALGILIPIGSSLGRLFFELGGSAESASKAVDDLKTALEELKEVTEDTSEFMEAALKLPFSAANEELKALMATYKAMKGEVAKDAFATAITPLVGNVADMLDELNSQKADMANTIRMSKMPISGTPLAEGEEEQIRAEMAKLTAMQIGAGQFLTKIQTALKGPSEDLASNMLKVSMAFSQSDLASASMKDQLHLALAESGLLAEMAQERIKAQADKDKKAKDGADFMRVVNENEAKLLAEDAKRRDAVEKEYQDRLLRTKIIMGQIAAERSKAEKDISEEDRVAAIATAAKLELELFKENAAYEKKIKGLDAAGDLAILTNQAKTEKELMESNAKYEREQDAIRSKELDETNKKITEMAERLAIPFAAALGLIRQAKAEASVGMEAFGGAGEYKYSGTSTFDGEAVYDARVKAAKALADALAEETEALENQAKQMNLAANATDKYKDEYDKLLKLRGNGLTEEAFANEVAKLNKELANSSPVLQGFTDAFSDFLGRGANDFKAFANDIISMFKNMIVKMIATAAQNKIMLSMGMGGGALGAAAQAGQLAGVGSPAGGGMMGNMIGGFGGGGAAGTGMLGGAMSSLSGFASGGMSGGLSAMSTAMSGATTSMAGFGTAIGAVAGPLLVVAAAVSFFKKKVTELDTGLEGTITNMDATISSFRKIQTKRFWGLSKKVSTSGEQLSDEDAAPMIKAVQEIQLSVMNAAAEFGIAGDVFDNFSHDFKLSLKGLSEEAKAAAIQEEFTKMGDAFAELTGHFETMAEALEAANQKMALRNRLDALLGNNAAILARNREAELAGMHDLNKNLAQMIYNLEDAQAAFAQADQAVGQAFQALRASIDAEKQGITDSFTGLMDGLKLRLDAANESMQRTQGIVNMLEGALSGRSATQGISSAFSRRSGASNFVSQGDFSDENKLKDALNVLGEPTEGLFGSFVDYARDFADTSRTLSDAKKVAEVQLNADEAAVVLLESQIEQATSNHDAQLAALDAQYTQQEAAYAALLGIDTSVKSVEVAIANLAGAMSAAAAAQAQATQAAAAARAADIAKAAAPVVEEVITSSPAASAVVSDVQKAKDVANEAYDKGYKTPSNNSNSNSNSGSSFSFSETISKVKSDISSGWDKIKSWAGFATGGSFGGGVRMVGERGPELEATGPSRVFSNKQTSSMFKDPELKDEIRSLKEEVTGLRSDNAQIMASNSKYVKRNYEINRKWDVEGLPDTRT